jgi:hypothetical protein
VLPEAPDTVTAESQTTTLPDDFADSPSTTLEAGEDADSSSGGGVSATEDSLFGADGLSSIEATYDEIPFLDRKVFDWTLADGGQSEAEEQDSVQAFTLTTETSFLWDAFDELQERIEQDGWRRTLVAGAAFVLAAVGSLAYIIWTVWGGYLVGSFVALMPHWHLVDPLPILDKEDDELEKADNESLESIATKHIYNDERASERITTHA